MMLTSFHILFCHLHVLISEIPIRVFCQFSNWMAWFLVLWDYVLLLTFESFLYSLNAKLLSGMW